MQIYIFASIYVYIYVSRPNWLKTTFVLHKFSCQRCAPNTAKRSEAIMTQNTGKRYGFPKKREPITATTEM